jgi:HTH-type transcriptional regulator, sugar sensing transcriptional regulator
MSQEKILEALEGLGLEKLDAQVYIFLGKKGPQKGKEIIKALKMSRQHLYHILKTLQNRGLVTATLEHPARFSVMPFEKALDLFVKAKMEEAQRLQRGKAEILSHWNEISVAETSDQSPRFNVIEGRKHIYPRLKQMIEETKSQLSIISTVSGLVRAEQFGLTNVALKRASKTNTKFRFLTELSEENLQAMKFLLEKMSKAKLVFEGRSPELGLKLFSRMVIRDDVEIAFFINKETGNTPATETDDVCLWTDCKDLVRSFTAVFEDLWNNASDIQKKIIEIETGRSSPKTFVIKDADAASKKYTAIMCSARKSIFILTSSAGILELLKDRNQLVAWVEKGISVRIMGPIIGENLKVVQNIGKICEVKHVPSNYVGTTIIDGQHLFQFKTSKSGKEILKPFSLFEDTFYTDDSEYVEKTENILNELWEKAQPPSFIEVGEIIQRTLSPNSSPTPRPLDLYKGEFKKIVGFSYITEPKDGKITENEIVDKIAKATRFPARKPEKDIVQLYGTGGTAVIYPHKDLKLPNFMIQTMHSNKFSSFGEENSLSLYIQMNIGDNQSYLQVTFLTDNPKGFEFRKAMHKNRNTKEVAYLLKKDELSVRTNTDGLFAAWTVPIPLLEPKYVLPPSSVMFEGYGKIKPLLSELKGPMNRRLVYEFNCLEAFVTFLHPSLKYSGPASDGLFYKDVIVTSYPLSA